MCNRFTRRSVIITVNGHTSILKPLEIARLPQESPLSLLLFLFFNGDLVKSVINKNRGAIAFVDDYSVWITGDSIESNITKLQTQVINPFEKLAAASSAIFRPEKSYLKHFTRNRNRLPAPRVKKSLILNHIAIHPSPGLKLPGDVLDQRLQYQEHIGKAAKKGLLATLALK